MLWVGLPWCPWPLATQLVPSGFLYPSRVFAPKCASCARPILPAQVGATHRVMTRCLAQPGLGLVPLGLAPNLGRDEQMPLPHIPQGRGVCSAVPTSAQASLHESERNGGPGLHGP